MTPYPTWKTLTIGTQTKEQLLAELEKEGHKVTDWSKKLIDQITFTKKKQTLELVNLSVSELGFKDSPTTEQITENITSLGLSLVPQETALYLRLDYTDQPMNEWVSCFSEPIAVAGGGLDVLSVARYSGGSWVRRDYADPDIVWDGGNRLLVCRKGSLPLESSDLLDTSDLEKEYVRGWNEALKMVRESLPSNMNI